MARKLDKSRPFAEIYGSHEARFDQFGILFDADGRELPGYEAVEVPKEEFNLLAVGGGDDAGLIALIEQLRQEKAELLGLLEDQEAATEEAQGRADSLAVEVERLRAELGGLGKGTDVNTDKGTDKALDKGTDKKNAGKAVDPNSLEGQLQLQGKE